MRSTEKGSLALEQILFIGAVVTMSVGVFAFYDNISSYFKNFDISSLPTQVNTSGTTPNGDTAPNTK